MNIAIRLSLIGRDFMLFLSLFTVVSALVIWAIIEIVFP